jgi:hypothetical protein
MRCRQLSWIAVWIASSGCGSDSSGMSRVSDASPSEAKLAALDARSAVVHDTTVAAYGHLLDRLSNKCVEARERIGDFAVVGTQHLKEGKNVTLSIRRFLEVMNESIPAEAATLQLKCAEVAAVLATTISRP